MSASARPERPETAVASAALAFEELERLVRHLGEELAFFRRRALEAERRLKELGPSGSAAAGGAPGAGAAAATARIGALEAENQDLRARLDEAATRTRQMAERVRFLRQQQESDSDR